MMQIVASLRRAWPDGGSLLLRRILRANRQRPQRSILSVIPVRRGGQRDSAGNRAQHTAGITPAPVGGIVLTAACPHAGISAGGVSADVPKLSNFRNDGPSNNAVTLTRTDWGSLYAK